jgi:hypothetical protein
VPAGREDLLRVSITAASGVPVRFLRIKLRSANLRRMKRLLAIVVTSTIAAALVAIQFSRASRENAENAGARKAALQTMPAKSWGLPVVADAGADAASTDIPQATLRAPNSGNVLIVPGLAPISLESGDAAPWESAMEAIANRADIPDLLKVRLFVQMLPGLPDEVVAKAAEEATIRLPDAEYRAVLLPTLLDPRTRGMAMSVFFADLAQRPKDVALPILLSIARDSTHPYSQFARENLQLALHRDFGSDWAKWDEAIRDHLGSSRK